MIDTEERHIFKKTERLRGAKRIDTLFLLGESYICYPFRVVYLQHKQSSVIGCAILVSVPKKRIKKAVDRNRIKRLIRESYRLNNKLLYNLDLKNRSLDIAFVYVKNTMSDFEEIEKAMQKTLRQIAVRINKISESE